MFPHDRMMKCIVVMKHYDTGVMGVSILEGEHVPGEEIPLVMP